MTKEIAGLVFTTYTVRGQVKIAHCQRINGRVGRAVVKNFSDESEAWSYAEQYARQA